MNELTTTNTNELATGAPQGFAFGFETVTAKDIKIPLIYVAQNMSDVVNDGNARPGDIVENLEKKVLGSKDKPAQIIPFYFQKTYQVKKLVNGKKEFYSNEPYTTEKPFEENKDGETYYNYPSYNFFVLVAGDETYTRYVLSFRGTRNITSGGRPMLSQLMQMYQVKRAPYEAVFDIGVKLVENDKGKWFVLTATQNKQILPDNKAKEYAKTYAIDIERMIKAGAIVDTSSVSDADETTQGENTPF